MTKFKWDGYDVMPNGDAEVIIYRAGGAAVIIYREACAEIAKLRRELNSSEIPDDGNVVEFIAGDAPKLPPREPGESQRDYRIRLSGIARPNPLLVHLRSNGDCDECGGRWVPGMVCDHGGCPFKRA